MKADGPFQSFFGRIALTVSAIIALGLVLFSVQSVIRVWRSSGQAPITNPTPVAQEQLSPEPVVSAPVVPALVGVQSGPEKHGFLQDFETIRQREKAEQETIRRRTKKAQENPDAGTGS